MSADEYLNQIINNKKAQVINLNDFRLARIIGLITNWAGTALSEIKRSGSQAKGTAIHGVADFDIFISLKSDTNMTLKQIYDSLDQAMINAGISTRRQNVSIGITEMGLRIDLVPGKIQSGYINYHSLYSSKNDSWMQANVDLHISQVVNSGRVSELILAKIWKNINNLEFPSIYLETFCLEYLKGKSKNNLSGNFWDLLQSISDNILTARIVDPSNTNNVLSDSIYKYEKEAIQKAAAASRQKKTWAEVIW